MESLELGHETLGCGEQWTRQELRALVGMKRKARLGAMDMV